MEDSRLQRPLPCAELADETSRSPTSISLMPGTPADTAQPIATNPRALTDVVHRCSGSSMNRGGEAILRAGGGFMTASWRKRPTRLWPKSKMASGSVARYAARAGVRVAPGLAQGVPACGCRALTLLAVGSRRRPRSPSARPLVSRITYPTIGPIAFALPARTRSAASGLAASAAATTAPAPVLAADRLEALARHDLRGSPPSASSRSSTCRRGAHADALARHQAHERRQRRRCDQRVRRLLAVRQPPHELAGDPVGERLRRAGRARPPRPAPPRSSRPAPPGRPAAARCRRSAPARAASARPEPAGSSHIAARAAASIRSSIATGTRSGSGK